MSETTDIGKLLTASDIQHILQVAGSPCSYDPEARYSNSNTSLSRAFHLHFYTGRVPTQAEHFYGVYVDRADDTRLGWPVSMRDRYLGRFTFVTGNYPAGSYAMNKVVRASGVVFPEDKEGLVGLSGGYERVPTPSYAKLTWMLDWTFLAGLTAALQRDEEYNSAYNLLWRWNEAGELLDKGRPTWFCLTPTSYAIHRHGTQNDIRNDAGTKVADIYQASPSDYTAPILMGTVGELGSGKDLEFKKSEMRYDGTHYIELASLRVIVDNFASGAS